ncbi:MAG TPA: serine/threonine-protein phosphatase [Sorangium sp.]|nr:serine/threonine-protein phosphatase [Sorangium sp.]
MSGSPLPGANIVAAGLTDVGRRRHHNEDYVLLKPALGLYLLLDGVGGRDAGDVASATAAHSMATFFADSDDTRWPDGYRTLLDLTLKPAAQRLCAAARKANHDVLALATASLSQPHARKPGTTLVAAYFPAAGPMLHLVHVGDSRGYRLRDRELLQLTRDHTLRNVAKLCRPDISADELATIPENVITRALGSRDNIELGVRSVAYQVGDTFLLCSDGLTHMVDDEHIREALMLADGPQDACELLVSLANEAGGRDNISVVVLRVSTPAAAV